MKVRICGDTTVIRLIKGEETVSALEEICRKEGILFATVSGIGAADRAVTCLYDIEKQQFEQQCLERPLELVSLLGNISEKDGAPYLHLHASFADASGAVYGGHLKEMRVSATAEIFIRRLPGRVGRIIDEQTGLNVLEL